MELVSRFFITLLIIAFGVGLYLLWNRWQLRRLRLDAGRAPGLQDWRAGRPAILYFTTPGCAPCRTVQRPALERLQAELGAQLQVLEWDASANPAIADHWGVLSVPTTFILDAHGQPQRVNHGVTSAEKLKHQLQELGALRPAAGAITRAEA
jgi:thioredoxin-like negative regulator of GroEL